MTIQKHDMKNTYKTSKMCFVIITQRLLNTKEAVQSTFLESSYVKYAEKSTWLELHSLNGSTFGET